MGYCSFDVTIGKMAEDLSKICLHSMDGCAIGQPES